MDWKSFGMMMTAVQLVVLVASFRVPGARVACGVLYLGVVAAGLLHRVILAVAGSTQTPRVTTAGLIVFSSIGVAELVWGHRTTGGRATT